jgi:hypothetical protein
MNLLEDIFDLIISEFLSIFRAINCELMHFLCCLLASGKEGENAPPSLIQKDFLNGCVNYKEGWKHTE